MNATTLPLRSRRGARRPIVLAALAAATLAVLVALAAMVLASHGPAAVSFDQERYAGNDNPVLTVDDEDLDADSNVADEAFVNLASATDPAGITVTLIETGPATGVFTNSTETVTFSTTATDDGTNTLKVAAGATVTLSYQDASPSQTVTDTATMLVDNASVAVDQEFYALADTGTVTVADIDRDTDLATADSVSVKVTSTSDSTGITLTAGESGASTGSFSAAFTFTEGSSSGTALQIAPGDAVTATYVEPLFDGVSTAAREDTATAGTNGSATLDKVRYQLSDSPTLTVVDPDLTGSSQNVTLTSTSDATGISVSLSGSAGTYSSATPSVTFSTLASSDDLNILKVAQGDTLTLTYAETTTFDGPEPVIATATMYVDDATASFDRETYASGEKATLRVFDIDGDTDTTAADVVSANLSTTSDTVGIPVTLTETGDSTGIFEGQAFLGTDVALAARDTITLTYDEPTFDPTLPATPVTATAGTYTDDATVVLNAEVYRNGDKATITVLDADRDTDTATADVITATLSTTTDGTGVSVTLTETTVDSGEFTGKATLGTDIALSAGDTITATYREPLFVGLGETTPRTDTARAYTDGATATLDKDEYARNATAFITVDDTDLNASSAAVETVSVNFSSPSDPDGISVILTETGDDTGLFRGSAEFSTSASSTALHVAPGQTVTLTYHEPLFDGTSTATRTDTAQMFTNGTVALDTDRYQANETVLITVVDTDLNAFTTTKDTVTVALESTTDTDGIEVTLTETDFDSGVFAGEATFSTSASDDANDVLKVAGGATVTVTYRETTTFEGTDANRTDTATMFNDTATATLDSAFYQLEDTATITVVDIDRDTDTTTRQDISVNLASTSHSSGITVVLSETATPGEFAGTAMFSATASNDTSDVLLIAPGDTVTLTYEEPAFAGTTVEVNRTYTAEVGTTGSASFDQRYYQSDGEALLTVVDTDLNTSPGSRETHSVSLISTTDSTGITVTLMESGVDTGVFEGGAQFTTDLLSLDSKLRVAAGDTISFSYAETTTFEGPNQTHTAMAKMYADQATVALDGDTYKNGDTITVTVLDLERDTDSALQQITADLTSKSAAGVITDTTTLTLTETGADTHAFVGAVVIGTGGLAVNDGDTITASYDEPTFAGGTPRTVTDEATTYNANNATVAFDADRYQLNSTAKVTVFDPDRNTDSASLESIVLQVSSDTDTVAPPRDTLDVTLNETDVNTGEFTGTFTFSAEDAGGALWVAAGNTVTVTYDEPGFDGTTTAKRDTATMTRNGTAALDASVYDLDDTATATVTDVDLNNSTTTAETVDVNVSSTTDSAGITVTLTESGPNTNAFVGTFTFTTGASSGTALQVSSGDTVELTYRETTTFDGPDADRTDAARMRSTGEASLDLERYALADTATLTVVDADANTAAGTAETVAVNLASDRDTVGVDITLTETGPDTGVFEASATFTEASSSGTALSVASSDMVTLTYADATKFDPASSDPADTATMFVDNATATLDKDTYQLSDTVRVNVADIDRDTDTAVADVITANLASSTDSTVITVTLTETAASTGEFKGTAAFTEGASGGGAVQYGSTITLTYAEPLFAGGTTDRTDTADTRTNATVAFGKRHYQVTETPSVTVVEPDADTSTSTDTISVTVKSTSDGTGGTGISLVLTETDTTSGVFTGTFTFDQTASSDLLDRLKVAEGDTLTAEYAETTTFDGTNAIRTATSTMFIDTGSVTLDQNKYRLADTATITVLDVDRDTDAAATDTVTVNLKSSSDTTGITVTLTETGPSTGTFTGDTTFTSGSSSGNALKLAGGDTMTATYAEPLFAGGTANRTDTASTFSDTGTAIFDADTYDLADTATITVVDTDADTDTASAGTVTVKLTSTSDSNGITVALDETTASSNQYTGTVGFTTGSSTASDIKVASGDTISVVYTEPLFTGGTAERSDSASMLTNGTATLDKTRYAVADSALLTVTDTDLNTSAGSADTVSVNLKSSSDTAGISVTLNETGNDTGVFTGTATFTTDSLSGTALKVAAGDTVTLTYEETTTFNGVNANRTDTANMFADTAAVAFDKSGYVVGETGKVTVADADRDATASADSVQAKVTSTTDSTGITVALTETGGSTGMFTASVTFTSGSSGGSSLQVTAGDTVTATYSEPTFAGGTANRTDTASVSAPSGGGGTSPTNPPPPTEPTDPMDPTDPTEPTNPTDPTDPTEPTDPTDPTNPTDPTIDEAAPRLSGSDRVLTSVAISQSAFADWDAATAAGHDTLRKARAVIIASGQDFPDALVGAPLARSRTAPLLLSWRDDLPDAVAAEITRVLEPGSIIYMLGGKAAIGAAVEQELAGLGYGVIRYSGTDRFDTAVRVARALGNPSRLFLADGLNFPDALSAGAAAATTRGAVVLTAGDAVPAATAAYLQSTTGTRYAIGGPAARAVPSAERVMGADRFATSVAVAERFFVDPAEVGVASGVAFPDALSGGAHSALLGAPLLLTAPDAVPSVLGDYLSSLAATIDVVSIYGGSAAISETVRQAIFDAVS